MWGIDVDYKYAGIIFILIPILIYGIVNLKQETTFWFIIITLAFCEGTFDLLGFTASINRLLRDLIIVTYFAFSLFLNRRFVLKYLVIIISFVLLCVISMLWNNSSLTELLLFWRRFLIYPLLFWLAFNSNLKVISKSKIYNYVVILFLIQVIFAFVKLILIGINENYIGSMSVRSGSLTTNYVLMGTAVSFILYLFRREKKYLFYIIGFLFFGIVGGKRAIIIYLPILILLIYYFYYKYVNSNRAQFLKNTFLISTIAFFSVYIIVITNPTLNPENQVGGSFNLNFVTEYIQTYNNDDRKGLGRQNAPELVFALLQNTGTENLILGLGPGDLISSSFNKKVGIVGDEQLMLDKYNIWYGGRTGFLWTIMQVGIAGLIIYILFFVVSFWKIVKLLKVSKNKELQLSVLALLIIFFLDFFTYSPTFTNSNILTYLLFISIGVGLRKFSTEVSNLQIEHYESTRNK